MATVLCLWGPCPFTRPLPHRVTSTGPVTARSPPPSSAPCWVLPCRSPPQFAERVSPTPWKVPGGGDWVPAPGRHAQVLQEHLLKIQPLRWSPTLCSPVPSPGATAPSSLSASTRLILRIPAPGARQAHSRPQAQAKRVSNAKNGAPCPPLLHEAPQALGDVACGPLSA